MSEHKVKDQIQFIFFTKTTLFSKSHCQKDMAQPAPDNSVVSCVICFSDDPAPTDRRANFPECTCKICYMHEPCWQAFIAHGEVSQLPSQCPTCRAAGGSRALEVSTSNNYGAVEDGRQNVDDPPQRYILGVPVNTHMESFGKVATVTSMLLHFSVAVTMASGVIEYTQDDNYTLFAITASLLVVYTYTILSSIADLVYNEFAYIYFHLNPVGKAFFGSVMLLRLFLMIVGLIQLLNEGQNLSLMLRIGTCIIFAELTVYAFFSVLIGIGCIGTVFC